MATKFLSKDVIGYGLIHRYQEHYRLSSMVFAIVTQIDFDGGVDEFLPISCSDEELGAAVRRCLDATKIIEPKDLPFKGDNAELKRRMQAWAERASELIGSKNQSTALNGASCATCVRTLRLTAFFNTNESPPGTFRSIPEHWPAYREYVVMHPVNDMDLGIATRSCLDAVVRNAHSDQ